MNVSGRAGVALVEEGTEPLDEEEEEEEEEELLGRLSFDLLLLLDLLGLEEDDEEEVDGEEAETGGLEK